jgi:3,4-dihydroxy 2-butanone 4-phosphate synthase/GTP cyclohydrolase II
MSTLAAAAEDFAAGAVVLVGDDRSETVFVAAAADRIGADELESVQDLGRGMVVLGLAGRVTRRLELPDARPDTRRPHLSLTIPIDAASGISGGWSLRDKALTMRVAADPGTVPGDLTTPGHVLPARIEDRSADAGAAAIELSRLAGRAPAVVLCPVVDRHGIPAGLRQARDDVRLRRLPYASSAELDSGAIERRAGVSAVSCELPVRDGLFRAVAYNPADGDAAVVALLHGDPAGAENPLVHIHVACLLGDAFGSLLCDCHRQLDVAAQAIFAEGAGVIVYAKPERPDLIVCTRDKPLDTTLAAGLLRACGLRNVRLSPGSERLSAELEARGLQVGASRETPVAGAGVA